MNTTLKSLSALLIAGGSILTSAPAHAVNFLLDDPSRPCLQWNVDFRNANQAGNELGGNQGNGFSTWFHLEQNGASITGRGKFMNNYFMGDRLRGEGTLKGTLVGNKIEFETTWGGVYWGQIDSAGLIKGITYKKGTTNWFDWTTDAPVECLKRGKRVAAPSQVKQPLSVPPQPITVPVATSDPAASQLGTGASRASSVFGPRPAPAPPPIPVPAVIPVASTPSLNCKSGYVWRVARPTDLVCVTPASRTLVAQENSVANSRIGRERGSYGRNNCKSGFVWREAFEGDVVCVTPVRRTLVAQENRIGPSLRAQ
jgi:hypothetical protein